MTMTIHRSLHRLRRTRDESGYIGVTAMGIMLLLLGTSIIMLGAVSDQVVSARDSREFTSARQGVDDATAAAVTDLNRDGTTATRFDPRQNGEDSGESEGTDYEWVYDAATRTLTSTGTFRDVEQTSTLPLRWLNVGSKGTTEAGSVLYGLAANGESRATTAAWTENAGAWAFGITSGAVSPDGEVERSEVRGSYCTLLRGRSASNRCTAGQTVNQFDYALLGGTALIDVPNYAYSAKPVRVLKYADSAVVEGTDSTEYRSHLNLQFDDELLYDRTSGQQFRDCKAAWAPRAGSAYPGYLYCAEAPVYTLPDVRATSGVVTIVVKGSVVVPADFNVGGQGQVHLYATGDVIFAKPMASGIQRMDNLFIYAPRGKCYTNEDARPIDLRGSLACRQITLTSEANWFTHVTPLPDTPAHAGGSDKVVYYTEGAGHLDTRTPGVVNP